VVCDVSLELDPDDVAVDVERFPVLPPVGVVLLVPQVGLFTSPEPQDPHASTSVDEFETTQHVQQHLLSAVSKWMNSYL